MENEIASDDIADARARMEAGDAEGAVTLLKARLHRGRGGLLTRVSLGRALLAAGQADEALQMLRDTVVLAPGVAEAAFALGEALLAAGHLPTAIAEFDRALRLDPGLEAARYALGCAWLEAGEVGRATEILNELAAAEPDLAERAARKLSEADAARLMTRSGPGYVRHLFDQFSADYDRRMLVELSYRAHLILRGLADLVVGAPEKLDILDLGCGTGLAGEVFKDLARRLDGVDLSPRMIEKARARGIYDGLTVGDLQSVLAGPGSSYDLMLAADTLVYFGDLGAVLRAVWARLRPGGFLLFTVEKMAGPGFELGPKRRYRHGEAYLRSEASQAGLEVMGLLDCSPRQEAKVPVEGLAVALQRN